MPNRLSDTTRKIAYNVGLVTSRRARSACEQGTKQNHSETTGLCKPSRAAELILHPDRSSLGAKHDQIEAAAFARVATVTALLAYAEAEATALLKSNIGIVNALVEALIEAGTLSGDEIDAIIRREVATKALANERARRAAWRIVEKSAAEFAAYGSKG
jgi:hypothetical protein